MPRVRTRNKLRGKLIVVEGIDGSGKSIQLHLLDKWLRHLGVLVFNTEWNSSAVVKEITSKGKRRALLTPTTFSLLHATDFADRYERNVLPLLHAGYFVLADRYVYTAYARDAVRGCHPQWVKRVYSFATKPDAVFYYHVPVEVGVRRILTGRPKLKYYEAGMDLNLSNDEYESYRIFQSRIIEQYKAMASKEGFIVMDGTLDVEQQQRMMRERVLGLLPSELAKVASKELSVT
ncbi:MAG: thymidylate kinase [Thaumarchaeota archaeon]|nr:thymidylate kinase [Nitrososphaerota archaeon]